MTDEPLKKISPEVTCSENEISWDFHLKSNHSADDQVLISSLLALAGNSGGHVVSPIVEAPANVYLCGECSSEFLSADDCSKHVALEHSKKIDNVKIELKCDRKPCCCSFSSKRNVDIHTACHFKNSGFKCSLCRDEVLFKKWKKCSLHLWKIHHIDLDLYQCPHCPKIRTATQGEMEIHSQIHSEDRKFVCSVCSKGFKQLAQLRNHSVTHMEKSSKEAVPTWFAKKQCDICQKFFADSKCLKKHVQAIHSKLKPYICQVCNHQCARKAMLEMHMRQHTGEKPFKYVYENYFPVCSHLFNAIRMVSCTA